MDYSFIKEPKDILKIKAEDVSTDLFKYCLASRKDGPRFKRTETFIMPKGTYPTVDKDIKTTVGNYLVNLGIFQNNERLISVVGYVNKRFGADVIHDIESKLSEALIDKKVITKDIIQYINNIQFYGFSLSDVFCASLTEKTVFMDKEIMDYKKKLLKEYGEDIQDPIKAVEMQGKLIKKAKEVIGDDPGLDLYESGSRASFGNNFSKLFLMNGPIMDLNTGKLRTSTSSYLEGVQKDELDLYANLNTASAYATAVNTQVGGYMVKKNMNMLQTLVLDKEGSDCGTKKTLPVLITKENMGYFDLRNIKKGSKIVQLNKSNITKYIGRTVEMYDHNCCIGDKICNKCAGDAYYKLGIENIGLTLSKLCSAIMNKSLKKKHDSTVKTYEIKDIESLYD